MITFGTLVCCWILPKRWAAEILWRRAELACKAAV